MKTKPLVRAAVPAILSLGACAGVPISSGEVERVLRTQAEAWNRGDLAGFVATYWDDARLTFCGSGGVVRGRKDLLAKYEASYPTAEARGRLQFDLIEVRPIGTDAALVLGRYQLERSAPASGYFTLVVQRTAQGLAIAHDHTSESK